jgi:site-specific DNA recombinase
VRMVFAIFEENRSLLLALAEIRGRGWKLKSWTTMTGRARTGGPFALNSLRRLLTNVIYTGSIRHKGVLYPGEHEAILAPGTWDRVQKLIAAREIFARGRSRNKHLALLSGLLYCESCATRMVYSYSGSQERRYRYYVCLNAQRKGWAVCPAKSLSASMIEESIVERIREAKRGIEDPGAWQKMDRTQQVEMVLGIVERIGYDGTTRQISIRFHPGAITGTGEGVRA